MELSKEYFHGLLLYDFKSGESAAASSCRINAAFGDVPVSKCAAEDGFARLRNCDLNIEVFARLRRPTKANNDQIATVDGIRPTAKHT